MLENPWVLETPAPGPDDARYYFSTTARCFRRRVVTVRDGTGGVRAALLVANRDGHLTVPYAFHAPGHEGSLVPALARVLGDTPRRTGITLYHPGLVEALRAAELPAAILRPEHRVSYVTTHLGFRLPDGVTLQDGDGDTGMT